MTAGPSHTDVAAYVLGVLDEPDTEAFELHLLDCPRCQDELRELQELPDLLDQVRDVRHTLPLHTDSRILPGLLERVARSRRRYVFHLTAAAAAVLLVVVPVVVLLFRPGGDAPRPTVAVAETLTGRNPATGANATITLEPTSWGTQVGLRLAGVTGPERCQLYAISRSTNERWVVAGWQVMPPGYGVPAAPDPLLLTGGTALAMQDIARFEIETDTGRRVVDVPS